MAAAGHGAYGLDHRHPHDLPGVYPAVRGILDPLPASRQVPDRPFGAAQQESSIVHLLPWDYLDKPFNAFNFHDLFWPVTVGSLFWAVTTIVLYNVRTRRFHGHAPYL